MSDYQRLVSYIYSYPGGSRDKNVGFAKAEVRNGQFKLNVSLKGVYTDTPETFGVHLMVEENDGFALLPAGNIMVNGGAGQYADLLNPANISGSGYRFEDISGIAVARKDNDYYRMFSLWKDAEIKPELITFLPKGYKKPEKTEKTDKAETVETAEKAEKDEEQGVVAAESVSEEYVAEESVSQESVLQESNELVLEEVATSDEEVVLENENKSVAQASSYDNNIQSAKASRSVSGEMGGIFDNADFIDVFDDDYYYDCVEVTPEQLQRLPIEDKAVVSNSFLEHGFYNFKHLLFGKVRENERHTKYFIGVPGMYCNRERFMATMFGYGNFKKSHRADCSNPYFGYWYQEI